MRRGLLAIVAAAALAAAVPAFAATTEVSIKNVAYNPSTVTIHVGDKVTWTNDDNGTPHSVTSDRGDPSSFNSTKAGTTCDPNTTTTGCMQPGDKFSVTFNQAGTFAYHCQVHASMHGVVKVVPKATPAPTPVRTLPPRTPTPAPRRTTAPVAHATASASTTPTVSPTPTESAGPLITPIGSPVSSPIALGTTQNPNRGPLIAIAIAAVALAAAGGALLWFRFRGTRP